MLRSEVSVDSAYVSFINSSSRVVDIVWFDYEGNMIRYGVLQPKEVQHVNTFKGHPWKSFDHATGCDMSLNGEPVFFPVSVREIHERLQMIQVPIRSLRCQRSPVYVTTPFAPLDKLCEQEIMKNISSIDDINRLEIPESLKRNLRQILHKKEHFFMNLTNVG